jgi:hypothetical protein
VLPQALASGQYPIISSVLNEYNLTNEKAKAVNYNQIFTSPWAPTYEMVSF